eukprot:UN32316
MSKSELVMKFSIKSLTSIVEQIPKESLPEYIQTFYDTVKSIAYDINGDRVVTIPGFNVEKALVPILKVYKQSLLKGEVEQRRFAAQLFGEVVQLTKKMSSREITQSTGPLIRVCGDRFGPDIKAATIRTLRLLLIHAGIRVKMFVAQMQTTFLKAIIGQFSEVREAGVDALCELMKINPRADNLIKDLMNKLNATKPEEKPRYISLLDALSRSLVVCGSKVKDEP